MSLSSTGLRYGEMSLEEYNHCFMLRKCICQLIKKLNEVFLNINYR